MQKLFEKEKMTTFPNPDQHFGGFTYSQSGEDLALLNIFTLLFEAEVGTSPVMRPFWIDIGSHHPTYLSNTKLFYQRGFRGINIEPNSNLIGIFNYERADDINLNIGVGTEHGFANFYMFDIFSGRNTFSKKEAEEYALKYSHPVKETVILPVWTLNQVVHTYCESQFPPLLLIDAEGLDIEIIRNTDFNFYGSPRVICVECRKPHTGQMESLLLPYRYLLYQRCGDNLIFLKNEDYRKVIY